MSVMSKTDIENKPKATMKNFQFVENLDKLIDVAEKEEESDEPLKDNRRSSYDLVMIRSRYVDRYDWYDTIFEKNGKYGTMDATGKVLLPAQYDGIGELCHKIYCGNIPRVAKLNGKAGLVKPDGSGEALTPFVYDSISYMLIEPYYTVKKNGKFGIIGKDGHVIAPCILDEITHGNGQCLVLRSGSKFGFLDRTCNDLYIAPQYDKVEFVDMEQPCIVTILLVKNEQDTVIRVSLHPAAPTKIITNHTQISYQKVPVVVSSIGHLLEGAKKKV